MLEILKIKQMKKTFNINLAGFPFIIDEDAYKMLKEYLDTIRYAFGSSEDAGEIANDIESRIAEILLEQDSAGNRIITIQDISSVIERIGKPEEIFEIEETLTVTDQSDKEDSSSGDTPPPYNGPAQSSAVKKRLFRDADNKLLGGVCSGLAAYFNIDPTIVRLIAVILLFLSASTVAIVYIILWIVIPPAVTPFQKIQMYGKNPTMENIGKTVTENFQEETGSGQYSNHKQSFGEIIANIFSVLIKCILILSLIIGAPIIVALLVVLVVSIISYFIAESTLINTGFVGDFLDFAAPGGGVLFFYLLLAAIGAIITICVPIWLVIRLIFKRDDNNISSNNRRSLLIIWLAGIALCAVFTVKTIKKAENINSCKLLDIEKIEDLSIEEKEIENVSISNEGVVIEGKNGKNITVSKDGIKIKKGGNNTVVESDTIIMNEETNTLSSDSIHP